MATMLRLLLILAATVALASPELLAKAGANLATSSLNIEEITQIMNDDDPSGQNHSIRVTIADHDPLDDVVEWKLFLHSNEEGAVSYKIPGDGENPSIQTEFVFNGNLVTSDSYLLQAKDASEDIAMDFKVAHITDLETSLAWVGGERSLPTSSLRIWTSEQVGNITVDGNVCTYDDNPCYIIAPETKVSHIKRCVNISVSSDQVMRQCDERVTLYKEMGESLPIDLQEDGALTVEFTYPGEHFSVEVVTYDPLNKTNVFSEYPYKCRFPIGQIRKEGDKTVCRHTLTLPEEQKEMMVLIVVIDDEHRVKRSALQYFDKKAQSKLSIEKVSRVLREDDPTGEKHNIRVTFSHQSLPFVAKWKLTLHKNFRDLITYTTDADGSNPSTQTEVIFEGKLLESDAIALQAWNADGKMLVIDLLTVHIPEIKSQVTWVGEEKEKSLRATTNDNFPEIHVGDEVCTKRTSPCYYITPSAKYSSAERCSTKYLQQDRVLQLCDERVTEIPEISPEPSVSVTEDGKISVQLKLADKEEFQVEVLAYTSDDHSLVSSKEDHSCLIATGVESREEDTVTCLHRVSLPEGKIDITVLIVKTDKEGNAIASSLVHHGGNPDANENVGIIIGAVVGAIIGVALVAVLIIYCMRKKEPATASQSTSYKYSEAKQEDKGEGATTNATEEP
ncbi:uncharacterized protein [Macrobrachium rosenbergii]|uniref:uncharacterized protein n=1 Tax=Macrobrachium rosenbergii TaxID=79674 RepID=UPI0034D6CDEF